MSFSVLAGRSKAAAIHVSSIFRRWIRFSAWLVNWNFMRWILRSLWIGDKS
jgi:hypothetical protein